MINFILIILVLFLTTCSQDTLLKSDEIIKPFPDNARIIELPEDVDEQILSEAEFDILPRQVLLGGLKSTLDTFVEEKLPFDEPRVEVGQEDGKLRELWQVAWAKGRGRFGYRGEWYYVRSNEGNAIPPQVCADVIVDTFDRLGGSWWVDNRRIDTDSSFTNMVKSQGKYQRRVLDLVQVMKSKPDYFEELYSKEREGVKLNNINNVHIVFNELQLSLGDIVFINGTTPWDKTHEHWHSFFVYNLDMNKGDWVIVGNAGMLSKRWLKSEANRTPQRRIWYIFRPTSLFLNKLTNKEKLF